MSKKTGPAGDPYVLAQLREVQARIVEAEIGMEQLCARRRQLMLDAQNDGEGFRGLYHHELADYLDHSKAWATAELNRAREEAA